jgi:hypothetical protein
MMGKELELEGFRAQQWADVSCGEERPTQLLRGALMPSLRLELDRCPRVPLSPFCDRGQLVLKFSFPSPYSWQASELLDIHCLKS